MYMKFYGFSEDPFQISPDPRFLYMTNTHLGAMPSMIAGIRTGRGSRSYWARSVRKNDPLVYALLKDLSDKIKIAFVFRTTVGFQDFLRNILQELGEEIVEDNLTLGQCLIITILSVPLICIDISNKFNYLAICHSMLYASTHTEQRKDYMALTKIDIVQNVSDRLGFSRKDSIRIVESMLEIIKEQLSQGNAVKISGFGNFFVETKNARKGRNPHTGAECEISARKVLTFKSSQILRKTLNKGN